MKVFAILVFGLLPAIGLALAIRTWLFLRHGSRVTARIVGHKEEQHWSGSIDTDSRSFLPIVSFRDELGKAHRVTLKQERPRTWRGLQEDEIKLVYRRGDPQNPRIAHWGLLWLGPALLCGPAIVLLLAWGWLLLAARLRG